MLVSAFLLFSLTDGQKKTGKSGTKAAYPFRRSKSGKNLNTLKNNNLMRRKKKKKKLDKSTLGLRNLVRHPMAPPTKKFKDKKKEQSKRRCRD
jgi:hypothetical protein